MKYIQKVYWSQEQIQKDKDLSQNVKDFWTKKSSNIDGFWNTKSNRHLFEKQQKYGVPIVRLWNSNGVDINPQLHKMGFERFMSPPEIYQEISMFLGGLTAPEKEIVTISDKDKIVEHGFDKWSFRKMPGEKKRRKNKRENTK